MIWKSLRKKHLSNEKYHGDLILQKTFSQDHLTKKTLINRGELPKYHVEGSHEPIISKKIFDAVQAEFARRSLKYHPSKEVSTDSKFPFTGLIICDKCGSRYQRKIAGSAPKYKKAVWICNTFNTLGKSICDSQQIPESILYAKSAEILRLSTFDDDIFSAKVKEIRVPAASKLIFTFYDGTAIETEWENPSRRHSWTDQMKQEARERQNKIIFHQSKRWSDSHIQPLLYLSKRGGLSS